VSEPKIRRKFKSVPVTLTTAVDSATAIRWDDVAGGSLAIGTCSTNATSVQVWAAPTVGGTYGRLYDSSGSAADITLASSTSTPTTYAMPDACYGVGGVKLVAGQADGTATTATVLLKS
jgi:hypothetical protein